MQPDHSFCWKNHHLLAAQLVTSSLRLARESIIIRRFLFSLRGKSSDLLLHSDLQRRWKMHFLWCLLCLNTPHSGGGGSHGPGGRFTDWDHHWGGLSWHSLAAGAPHGASASVHYEPAEKAPGAKTRELTGKSPCSLHTPTELCCCNVSFFFSLRVISYTWIVHCLCKVSPRGSPHGILTSWCSKWSRFLLPPTSSVGGSRG